MSAKRIIDCLQANAQRCPDKVFIYDCEGTLRLTYAEFWQQVQLRAASLTEGGWRQGDAMCIRSTQSASYLVLYFACHLLGIIIVPLEHDLPEARVQDVNVRVRVIQKQLPGHVFPSSVSDVLFTSGTTGQPKGVVVSHQAMMADAVNLKVAQGFHHDIVFIINGPLNHAGCWTKVLPVVMEGGSLYLMPGMKNLDSFFTALDFIRRLPVSADTHRQPTAAVFLVPASIRMLLQFSQDRLAQYADVIEFIETGAAHIPHSDMLRLCELLPDSRLFNTYASSETGVVCTYNFNDGKCLPGCVGHPMKLARVSLRDDVLVCRGDALMMGYLGQTDFSQPSLKEIVTSDLGRFDEEGRLYLVGRQNDVINVGGLKVSPAEVEEEALDIDGIADCICVADSHSLMGSVPKLLVVMEPGVLFDKRAIAAHLRSALEAYKVPAKYEQVDHIERNANGKLNRKFYAAQ
ncbi:MAG: acyl--CoA ligase [Bacteroidales bacterium]|nr:acyl--CoA ligase [Candidatus Liminaster caballi]